jgi:F-type H+-transporting ATPase subunit a
MARWTWASTLLWAQLAFAQGAPVGEDTRHAPGEAVHKEDISGFIFHHVSDSHEYEFEIPLSREHPHFTFPMLRIPLRADAVCPQDPHAQVGLSEGCLDLSITKHVAAMWLAGLLLIGVFVFGAHRNKQDLVPRGKLANFLEMMVLFVRDEIAIKNIGKEQGPRYAGYLLTAFFFILFMNLLGLFPWMATPTANLGVTAALALCTFVLTQLAGIRAAGIGGYLKHLTGGVHWLLWPIMIPVEILGLFTKPFALTIRLFANMLAGHVVIFFLLGLIFIMNSAAWAVIAVPFAFAIYLLEIFVAFVQAYIFTMLSALFIGMGVAMGHHDEHHPEPEGSRSHDHGAGHVLGS